MANPTLYMQWHFSQEKKRNKHRAVISHLLTKVFELDTLCFVSVIDLFPISKCSIPQLCFDFKWGGKVWLLKENTICNSRRFIYCIYNTQGCSKSLIIWLCYLILSFQKCLITLSWENLTNYNYCSALKPSMWLDEWQTYCVSMVTALVRVTFCCSMFEFRQPLWSWNASVKELACG